MHILYVPFLGMGKIDRGDKWLKNRLEIFKRYVLNALCNQSNLSFTLWLSFRPEDEFNPIVKDFERGMHQIRAMSPVFTYNGLCFWDDKFSEEEAGEKLYNNLRKSLPFLKQHVDHADEVYLTIQPSDDMFLASAVSDIQKADFKGKKVVGWTKGFTIRYDTKEIANYDPTTIPPFFTIRFPKDTFLDPEKHMEWSGPYKSHEFVKDLGFEELQGRKFVVGCHGGNISTTFDTFKGRSLTKEEQEKVLLETATYFTEPIVIKQNPRLLARKLLRYLPFSSIIRDIYYKLGLNRHVY
jgi:hypothetical protein